MPGNRMTAMVAISSFLFLDSLAAMGYGTYLLILYAPFYDPYSDAGVLVIAGSSIMVLLGASLFAGSVSVFVASSRGSARALIAHKAIIGASTILAAGLVTVWALVYVWFGAIAIELIAIGGFALLLCLLDIAFAVIYHRGKGAENAVSPVSAAFTPGPAYIANNQAATMPYGRTSTAVDPYAQPYKQVEPKEGQQMTRSKSKASLNGSVLSVEAIA
ncbi:hypothetical protein DFJ74DRAFT_759234 [Hyaloraphidium curvatum]|nr:hypothetical protein DFJ74DRAFT_759234 [Hyaloraphidium curvatum]